jgi:hypothetical protein
LRIVGGPTYFSAHEQAVSHIYWNQVWVGTTNTVNVTSTELTDVQASTWGFNVGTDVSYFFNNVIGIGGLARYSHGSVTFDNDEAMSDTPMPAKVGGFQAAFGLRLRFGQK